MIHSRHLTQNKRTRERERERNREADRVREKDYRRVIKICLGSMNLKRGLSRCISKCSLHRLSHQTRHANTQKTWRAYIQTNTRALRGTVLSYCPWPIFPFLECLFFTSARYSIYIQYIDLGPVSSVLSSNSGRTAGGDWGC